MKIIFFGSDDFAASHLEKLLASAFDVVACVTQPDRPKGRGLKLTMSPIKEIAMRENIPVCQPADMKETSFLEFLKEKAPDLFVVIAYGKILTQDILDIPKYFCINVHSSLLPLYRGAAPINWVVINGEKETGISIIKMCEQCDAGDILAQETISIADEDTAVTLRKRMAEIVGPDLLCKTIEAIANGKETCTVQDGSKVTFAPKLTKELGQIDWTRPAVDIHNLVRGLLPWPGAYTTYNGDLLKVLKAEVCDDPGENQPGEIFAVDKDSVKVATGQSGLKITEVQLAGSKPMAMKDFLSGHSLQPGDRLGDR